MPRNVTSQRDIALRAGVSQSAVSFVLNGRSEEMGIPEATRERIRQVVDELRYVPNVAARALRNARNDLIGVYTYERVFPLSPSDYYNEFLHGIEEGAVSLGLDLVLFTSALATGEGTGSVFRAGSNRLGIADGTVMLGSKKSDEELARLVGEGYPFVFVGRRDVPGVVVPCVTADYFTAMSAVVELLTSYGHERVLYIGCRTPSRPQQERRFGYQHYASQPAGDESIVSLEAEDIDDDRLKGWVNGGWSAVVAETSDITRSIVRAAHSSGIDIPQDLSLVALDVGLADDAFEVSHIEVPRREMGRRAVSLLSQIITDGGTSNPAVSLHCAPPTAVTVAPPPASPPRHARHLG